MQMRREKFGRIEWLFTNHSVYMAYGYKYVFTQPIHYEHDATQGQFLKGLQLV